MKAGRLRFKFLIQNPHPAHTTAGDYTSGWTDHGEIYGDVQGLSGRDKFYAAQAGSLATHLVTTRWTDVITARTRLLLDAGQVGSGTSQEPRVVTGTRIFNVESAVDPDNRRKELRLSCVERT